MYDTPLSTSLGASANLDNPALQDPLQAETCQEPCAPGEGLRIPRRHPLLPDDCIARPRSALPSGRRLAMAAINKDAVEYWRNLGLRIDDEGFNKAGAQAQALAITIIEVTELRLLQVFKDSVAQGLEKALSLDNVRALLFKEFGAESLEDETGDGEQAEKNLAARLELEEIDDAGLLDPAIRTSMDRAMHAGQWRELQRGAMGGGEMPLLQYSASNAGGACDGHRSLHGLVRAHDDPVWREFWPPNGLDCSCVVNAIDRSQASALGLSLTSDERLSEMRSGLSGIIRRGFCIAEDPLLPLAEALTHKFKTAENTVEQHRRNAMEWEGIPRLAKVLQNRYEDGVDVFAVGKHDVSSRGEMSLDIAVLPSNFPHELGGHVVRVTDGVYKDIYRKLTKSLLSHQSLQRPAIPVSDDGMRGIALQIMKSVMSGLMPGNTITVGMSEFFLGTISEKVWIQFKHKDDSVGMHYYEMRRMLWVSSFLDWSKDKQKVNASFGAFTI